jgi:hypothetical protein
MVLYTLILKPVKLKLSPKMYVYTLFLFLFVFLLSIFVLMQLGLNTPEEAVSRVGKSTHLTQRLDTYTQIIEKVPSILCFQHIL